LHLTYFTSTYRETEQLEKIFEKQHDYADNSNEAIKKKVVKNFIEKKTCEAL